MVYEADRDGKDQVAASWLLTQREKGERMEPAARTLEPTQRERGNAAKRRNWWARVLYPHPLAMEGSGLMERVTFLLNYYKEQTQGTFMSMGTNELHMEQQKVHKNSYAYMNTQTHTKPSTQTPAQTYIHKGIYMHAYSNTHTCTDMHKHTNIHNHSRCTL